MTRFIQKFMIATIATTKRRKNAGVKRKGARRSLRFVAIVDGVKSVLCVMDRVFSNGIVALVPFVLIVISCAPCPIFITGLELIAETTRMGKGCIISP